MKENKNVPQIEIRLDCVPKDIEERKRNLKHFYDVCNQIFKNKDCFYTPEEIEELKNNKELREKMNITFI